MNADPQSMTTPSDGNAVADGSPGDWMREIGVCAVLTVLLVLDIDALGCEQGFALLDRVALHLWGPGY